MDDQKAEGQETSKSSVTGHGDDLGELAWRRIALGLIVFFVIAAFNPLGVKQNSEAATQDFFETVFASVLPFGAITTTEDAYRHILNYSPLAYRHLNEIAAEKFTQQMQLLVKPEWTGVDFWKEQRKKRSEVPSKAQPWAPIQILRFDDTVMATIYPPERDEYRRFARHQLPLEKLKLMLRLLARLEVSVVFFDIRFLTDNVSKKPFCQEQAALWRRYTRHPDEKLPDTPTGRERSKLPFLFLAGLPTGHAIRAGVADAMDARLWANGISSAPILSGSDERTPDIHGSTTQENPFWLPKRFECLRDIGKLVPVQWNGKDYPIAVDAQESNHQPRTIHGLQSLVETNSGRWGDGGVKPAWARDPLPSAVVDIFASWCTHPTSLILHFPQCNVELLRRRNPTTTEHDIRQIIKAGLGVKFAEGENVEQRRLAVRPYARTPVLYGALADSSDVHGCRQEEIFLDDNNVHFWRALIGDARTWGAIYGHLRYGLSRLQDEVIGNRDGTDDVYARGCANIPMHEAFFTPKTWPLASEQKWVSYVKQSFIGSTVIVAGNFDNAPDTAPSSLFGNKIGAFVHAEALQCLLWYADLCPRRAGNVTRALGLDLNWHLDWMDVIELGVLLIILLMSRSIVRDAFMSGANIVSDQASRKFLWSNVRRDYAVGYQSALVVNLPFALFATVVGMAFLPYPSADLLALTLVLGVVFREGAVGVVQRVLWHLAPRDHPIVILAVLALWALLMSVV